jgi:hypothetical protein
MIGRKLGVDRSDQEEEMKLPLLIAATVVGLGLFVASCTKHQVQVDPIEVKPIHVTVDINLKVDRELEDFFDFEEPIEEAVAEEEGGEK